MLSLLLFVICRMFLTRPSAEQEAAKVERLSIAPGIPMIEIGQRWGLDKHTPWKINMDHNDGGLEDHFPFQMGDL